MSSLAEMTPTMFERIGGAVTIDRLVELFYDRMETLPEAEGILRLHDADLTATRRVFKRYLTEWMGGPKLYTPEKGHPRLRMRHMRAPIGAAERDAWLLCMRGALDATVADQADREEIYDLMAKLADWMRNTDGNPHDAGGSPP